MWNKLMINLGLSAGHWSQLSQSGGEERREHERRPQQSENGRSQPHPQGLLQEVDGDFEEGTGEVDAQLDHVMGASGSGPATAEHTLDSRATSAYSIKGPHRFPEHFV